MLLVRRFEEAVRDLVANAKIHGFVHLSIGQEAIAAGVSAALRTDDYIVSTHRGHGHLIARGADIRRMMAELLGRRTGCCKGRGGSFHLVDISRGILGMSGIVGGGLPMASGAGLAIRLRKTDQVIACFFGEGAANQGTFHESVNLSAIWKLPVIWICENNLYAIATPISASLNVADVASMASSYAIPATIVDGNDVVQVYENTKKAVARARRGEGPTLIECKTYRQRGHFEGDPTLYRSREEEQEWLKRDPIENLQAEMLRNGLLTRDQLQEIRSEIEALVTDAVTFAEESALPDPGDALIDVFYTP
jgi:pyruvate dehydrogenase E1 component alpha subunit